MAEPVIARPRWRDTRILRAVHLMLAAERREVSPVLDGARLEKALTAPRALVQAGNPDPVRLAASYAAAAARALTDGSGAFALATLETVLRLNGLTLEASEAEAAGVVGDFASGAISLTELETWARSKSARL
jgi:prophage maintenance system killer protein